MFFKYIEKKVVRHIHDNFSCFLFSDEPDESDEEYIKAIRINADL